MALKRENGAEQPYIPAGIFKIRLPFIHYRWEISECLQAILMCATCLGAIPVLQDVLGVPYEVAWSMVIINGFFYNMHSLLGDPVVPGWITPAIPLVTAFLTLSEQGPDRTQTMIALQLMVGLIFLFMGITGLASKIIGAIPDAIKAGILVGAGFSAIMGEFKEGGRAGLYPTTVIIGSLIAYFLLFSLLFKRMKAKNKLWYMVGNFGMLPAIIIAIIIGPLSGELPPPNLVLGSIIKIPEFGAIWNTLSPFSIGFPGIGKFISVIPTAIAVYIIAFGDFVSSEQLLRTADEVRQDEKIDFNANRSNIVSAIRNLVQAFICPYPSLCGPLWAAVTAAVAERYKDGRKSMDSIFSGVGTFRWSTFICVALVPVASFVQPILPAALSLTLIVQGFVCCQIGLSMIHSDSERGLAGVMASVLAIKGATWGLAVGVILYILINGTFKNPEPAKNAANA
ncbi:MAG: hypothetical protein HFG14_10780 [Lachnospiraceae bacterium]|jgi:hypothetical protein|nr:hypothetical protein [uncultured Acetatifactor sp.]MCI9570340.1 hypothetical protein [Lachnospiraceae bacterium]NBJ83442.1 hypothetical protein [bacterium 1XD42-76]NBK06724.1 hypothetical protein [bacterium 1XD42-94]